MELCNSSDTPVGKVGEATIRLSTEWSSLSFRGFVILGYANLRGRPKNQINKTLNSPEHSNMF